MKAELSLTFLGSRLRGTFYTLFPTPGGITRMEFDATCDIHYDRFVQLNYRSKASGKVQFGAIVLEIEDTGKAMKGSYTGYGAISRMIVSGTVELEKQAS
jgi:hypothetical protein